MKCDKCGCECADPVKCPCPLAGGWPIEPDNDHGETAHWTIPSTVRGSQSGLMYDSRPPGGRWSAWGKLPTMEITQQQAVDMFRLMLAMRAVIKPEPE